MTSSKQAPLNALQALARTKPSNYPEPFRSMMAGRVKRPLGDLFGLTNFGVNITTLPPGTVSALLHGHSKQDEFIYIVTGEATLYTTAGKQVLSAGMCAGFKAADGDAHRLANESQEVMVYLEVGDRTPGDVVHYPEDDLAAAMVDGAWKFSHKDGTPYA